MTHDELVMRAVKWLKTPVSARNPVPISEYDKMHYKPACGVAIPELVSGNYGEIPDAFGWDRDNSWLIECKTSRADFLADRRKLRTGIGEYHFYMCPPDLIKPIEVPGEWGLLYCYPKKVSVVIWAGRRRDRNIRGEMAMMYSLLRRCEIRGFVRQCLADKWKGRNHEST